MPMENISIELVYQNPVKLVHQKSAICFKCKSRYDIDVSDLQIIAKPEIFAVADFGIDINLNCPKCMAIGDSSKCAIVDREFAPLIMEYINAQSYSSMYNKILSLNLSEWSAGSIGIKQGINSKPIVDHQPAKISFYSAKYTKDAMTKVQEFFDRLGMPYGWEIRYWQGSDARYIKDSIHIVERPIFGEIPTDTADPIDLRTLQTRYHNNMEALAQWWTRRFIPALFQINTEVKSGERK